MLKIEFEAFTELLLLFDFYRLNKKGLKLLSKLNLFFVLLLILLLFLLKIFVTG